MRIEFYHEDGDDDPHFARHQVTEAEVEDVLAHPLEDIPGRQGARIAYGQTSNGRWLRVIYREKGDPPFIQVLTAFDPGRKVVRALRRRLGKKR